MKSMKCIKANFKLFMNFMVEAAEVELQEKTMGKAAARHVVCLTPHF